MHCLWGQMFIRCYGLLYFNGCISSCLLLLRIVSSTSPLCCHPCVLEGCCHFRNGWCCQGNWHHYLRIARPFHLMYQIGSRPGSYVIGVLWHHSCSWRRWHCALLPYRLPYHGTVIAIALSELGDCSWGIIVVSMLWCCWREVFHISKWLHCCCFVGDTRRWTCLFPFPYSTVGNIVSPFAIALASSCFCCIFRRLEMTGAISVTGLTACLTAWTLNAMEKNE